MALCGFCVELIWTNSIRHVHLSLLLPSPYPPHKLQRQQYRLRGLPGIFTHEKTSHPPSTCPKLWQRTQLCCSLLPPFFTSPFLPAPSSSLGFSRSIHVSNAQHHNTDHITHFWAALQSYQAMLPTPDWSSNWTCSSPFLVAEQPMDKMQCVSQRQCSPMTSHPGIQKCDTSSGIKGYNKSDYCYLLQNTTQFFKLINFLT